MNPSNNLMSFLKDYFDSMSSEVEAMPTPVVWGKLRKIECSKEVEEVLKEVDEIVSGGNITDEQDKHATKLLDIHVFREHPENRKILQSSMFHIQIAEIIYHYLLGMPNDKMENFFSFIFDEYLQGNRLIVLSRLTDIVIRESSEDVLMCVNSWMQTMGNTSEECCVFAETLIKKYLVYYFDLNENITALKNLSEKCPEFVGNFLTAIAENCFKKWPVVNLIEVPSNSLLEIVVFWISKLDICKLIQQTTESYPLAVKDNTPKENVAPIAGLFKWCILAPIHDQFNKCYVKLLSLLVDKISKIPRDHSTKAVHSQSFIQLTGHLSGYVNVNKSIEESDWSDSLLQMSLELFGEAMQALYAANAIYGDVNGLMEEIMMLPYNKSLNIVVNNYYNDIVRE